jgi:hypothetical protein
MNEYHKIQTVFKRDMTKRGQIIVGEYSLPEFEYLASCKWRFTEKVDGTNVRVMWDGTTVRLGGKTDNAQLHTGLVANLQAIFPAALFVSSFPECSEVCLYGEGYGAKIQKGGGHYADTQKFVLFDVKVGPWWLERINVEDVAAKMVLDVVPVIGSGTLPEMVEQVKAGIGSHWGDFRAEGIVARPSVTLFTRSGDRIITKLKTKDFE